MTDTSNNFGSGSFNEDFCLYLEYYLSRTFGNSTDQRLHVLWCDGVQMPYNESQLSSRNINRLKKIETKAWIGANGQDIYDMTIKLGPESLAKYAEGQSLKDCLPSEKQFDRVTIDIDGAIVELQLL
jgi:hypothetical protein